MADPKAILQTAFLGARSRARRHQRSGQQRGLWGRCHVEDGAGAADRGPPEHLPQVPPQAPPPAPPP